MSGARAVRAAKADRSRLPAPRPSPALPFPAIEKATLENGLRVWTVRHTQVPLVAFMLLVRRGAASDPAGKDGLAAVTADMLDEGSGERSAIEIHEALARLGAQFDTDIGSDATVASVSQVALDLFLQRPPRHRPVAREIAIEERGIADEHVVRIQLIGLAAEAADGL